MYFHSQFPQDHNLDLMHVSVFLLLFFLNSNPTSIMVFIIFDSFVCTSFIQPVQRIQLKADPGSVVQGNSFCCCDSVKPPRSQAALSPAMVQMKHCSYSLSIMSTSFPFFLILICFFLRHFENFLFALDRLGSTLQ